MTQIQILEFERKSTHVDVVYKMIFTLPAALGTGTSPIAGLDAILASYPDSYRSEVIPVEGTVIVKTERATAGYDMQLNQMQSYLQSRYTTEVARINSISLNAYDNIAGLSWNGSVWGSSSLITDVPLDPVVQANLAVTATGAAGAAVTLTLPAEVGRFHSILHLTITAYATAAKTGAATPIVVTSTNIIGNPQFTFQSAFAIGTSAEKVISPALPIKSAVANTATTIVCPATTNLLWRVTAFYTTIPLTRSNGNFF